MKKALLFLTIVTFLSCQRQRDTYLITGDVKNIPDSAIIDLVVLYHDLGHTVSSDTIINGHFEFTDSLEIRPSKMSLIVRDWENFYGSCDIWVDYEVIKITGQGRFLSSWNVNSKVKEQIALNNLNSKTKVFAVTTDSLCMIWMNNTENRDISEQIRNKIDSIGQIRRKIEFDIIEDNPNSNSALEMLYRIAKIDTSMDKNRIKLVYDKLDTMYKNTLYGEGILSVLEEKKIPKIGDKMINFVAYDTDGQKHSLEEFKGKYILLNFWELFCGKEIQGTRELYSNNKAILTVIGVNMVTNDDLWRETSKKDSITWINLSDGKGTIAGVSSDYGINGSPTYVLINPEGVIIDKWMGYWPNVFKEKLSKHIEGLKI